jgi:toxin HigB-1
MIINIRHKGLKDLFETGSKKGVDATLAAKMVRQLDALDVVRTPDDLRFPGWGLHQLKGERTGTWSVKVNGNWRITFTFNNGDVENVDLEDYH